jgi:hypothetical protein
VVTGLTYQSEYLERYLAQCLPNTSAFHWLDQRMRESGIVLPTPLMDRDQLHLCWTSPLEEIVLVMDWMWWLCIVAWKITRPEPLGLLLETHEGTYLQGLAI